DDDRPDGALVRVRSARTSTGTRLPAGAVRGRWHPRHPSAPFTAGAAEAAPRLRALRARCVHRARTRHGTDPPGAHRAPGRRRAAAGRSGAVGASAGSHARAVGEAVERTRLIAWI